MQTRINSESGQMNLSLDVERRIFQVTELNSAIQNLFETEFRGIWVAGEISGCRAATSGHYYFCLKDAQSQLKCALFRNAARLARFKPQDGLAVLARGNLEVYETRGEYQLVIELLQPQGAGALQLAFEQLKKKLSAEGLFEQSRKRALPKLPRRIGIVTSPSGAVLHDILQILERRFRGIQVRIYPAQVQGEGAVEQVCRALKHFSETAWAEVVILARGGGSLEDLWTFNEEAVARMIVSSKVPVISAIGHEIDFTIADFAADYRAATPSAAAEIVICTRTSLLEQIAAHRAKTAQAIRFRLLSCSRDLHQRGTARGVTLLHRALAKRAQAIDDLEFRLRTMQRRSILGQARRLSDLAARLQATDLRLRLARNRHRQDTLTGLMSRTMETLISRARRRQETIQAHLRQLSPLTVLGRGYAIVENAEGRILRGSGETSAGEELRIRLHRGELGAVVSEVRFAE